MTGWLVLGLLACLGIQIHGEITEETELAASNANAQFTFDLLRKLHKEGSNVFYSPFSIAAAVAMTSLGATGNTLDEIDRAFYFDLVQRSSSDPKVLHELFKNTLTLYEQSNSNYSLSAANRLFAQKGFEIKEQFKNDTRDYYKAEVEQVVFGDGTAEGIINSWVEEKTHDKIKELFKPNSLSSDTILALVSAIYFKGNWKTKFDKANTRDMNFYTTPGESKTVQMMSITKNFRYYKDDEYNVQILELPYSGNDITMVVILPQQGELQQLVASINSSCLHNWLENTSSREVNVKIPKFKLETEYSLTEPLQELGVKDLFTNRCNLSEIISLGDVLSVSKVEHKAFVQVDEEGTEAAAATGVVAYLRTVTPRPREFFADHPFLFFIRHKHVSSDRILFIGTLSDPEE